VRDIVKAYYDKKGGRKDLQFTAKDGRPQFLQVSGNYPAIAPEQPTR
jgi:hypothetical protein